MGRRLQGAIPFGQRPSALYHPLLRKFPKRIEHYEYPANYLVRRVSRCGTIRFQHRQFFVSQTVNEEYVGLEEVDEGLYEMYFCFSLSGAMMCRTTKFWMLCRRYR